MFPKWTEGDKEQRNSVGRHAVSVMKIIIVQCGPLITEAQLLNQACIQPLSIQGFCSHTVQPPSVIDLPSVSVQRHMLSPGISSCHGLTHLDIAGTSYNMKALV